MFKRKLAALLLVAGLITAGCGGGTLTRLAGAATADDRPLTRAEITENRLALTFDVTWGTNELAKIQSLLDGHGIKATFFIGGTFLSLHSKAVKQLSAQGHEIGTLGEKIIDLSLLPEAEVSSNLLASQSALAKMLGGPVRYFRPPQGEATPAVVRAARTADLVTVAHSLDSMDFRGERAEVIVNRVVKRASKGDIVRLSASDWSPETAKALPAILKGIRDQGLEMVPVGQLVPEQ